MTNWPADADGDAFRRLEADGFDFSTPHVVDFNVAMPGDKVARLLRAALPHAKIKDVSEDDFGDVLVQVSEMLKYTFVIDMQRRLTDIVSALGGSCNEWAVEVRPRNH